MTPHWSHLGAITPTDSLSLLVTTSVDQLALLLLVCLSPVTQLLASQGCFQRVNILSSGVFSSSGTHHFATACLLPFSGSEKNNPCETKQ